jgi:DNA-binding CsgD family transcriptional regulator
MEHLILAVYVLLFTSGSACLVALAFLRYRLRSRIVADLLGVQILLLAGLTLVLVYFYLRNVVVGPEAPIVMKSIGAASTIVQAAVYALGFRMVAALRGGGRFRPALRVVAEALCVAVTATSLVFVLFAVVPGIEPRLFSENRALVSTTGYVLVGAALFALGLVLFSAPLQGEHPAVRLLARGWGVSLMAFAPLSGIEWALEAFGPLPYAPLSLDFIFYFSCNIVSVVAFARSLSVERRTDESPLFGAVSEDTAARYGLTSRERDMVPLIARGLANKEIASELGISDATVRTHIYNLFQKVGAKGRIELLNKLGS